MSLVANQQFTKRLPLWVKWGVGFALFPIVWYFLVPLPFLILASMYGWADRVGSIIVIPNEINGKLIKILIGESIAGFYVGILLFEIIYFLLGTMIGLIIQKFKNRKAV